MDWDKFLRASNPGFTLDVGKPDDRRYYIDFSSVRGVAINELASKIRAFSPQPTCQLFTGYIGCGKSTELLKLKTTLEEEEFHVVYFESTDYLEPENIDTSAILLVIASQINQSLSQIQIDEPQDFKGFVEKMASILRIDLRGDLELPGFGRVTFDSSGAIGLTVGILKITAKLKGNPDLSRQFKQLLNSQTIYLLNLINNELLVPASQRLTKGLVVIVDNLDRIPSRFLQTGETLAESVFLGGAGQLKGLKCHVVYTIPLELSFSNKGAEINDRLGGGLDPIVLPMIPVKLFPRLKEMKEEDFPDGIDRLRQMILARAFPNIRDESERMNCLKEVFDSQETLDRLCRFSGGNVRQLLKLLFLCISKVLASKRSSIDSVINCDILSKVIVKQGDNKSRQVKPAQWVLLSKVAKTKEFSEASTNTDLLRSLFVFEYQNENEGSWYDVNPLLANRIS